jgi:hypothetical protein
MDRTYHQAKLTAAAFNQPERIWDEHEAYRADSRKARAEVGPSCPATITWLWPFGSSANSPRPGSSPPIAERTDGC